LTSWLAQREFPVEIFRPLRARQHDRLEHVEQRSAGDDSHKELIERRDEIEFLL
jgi:hypothetical protein